MSKRKPSGKSPWSWLAIVCGIAWLIPLGLMFVDALFGMIGVMLALFVHVPLFIFAVAMLAFRKYESDEWLWTTVLLSGLFIAAAIFLGSSYNYGPGP